MRYILKNFLLSFLLLTAVLAGYTNVSADYLPPVTISTIPENPKEGESITLSVAGDFPDTCYKFEDADPIQHSLTGNNIDVWISYSVSIGMMCLDVLVPWTLKEEIGNLDKRQYYVTVYMNGILNNVSSFEVTAVCSNNFECSEGFYCAKSVGDCNGSGTCTSIPNICPTLLDPVCGCDGTTYPNECVAAIHLKSVEYKGECGTLKLGDVNRDGTVDISDVILELRRALCISCLPLPCSDINGDGYVDISEVILTLRIALGLDPLQPCTE
jgi:hypothetical protein